MRSSAAHPLLKGGENPLVSNSLFKQALDTRVWRDATRYPPQQGRCVWVTKAFAYFWPLKSKTSPTQMSFDFIEKLWQ